MGGTIDPATPAANMGIVASFLRTGGRLGSDEDKALLRDAGPLHRARWPAAGSRRSAAPGTR
jgi:hypothetical protein